ncbi:MAG: VOC family protein [Bryobacterales bacterium]|nr:VOC family protein [Bryobacterales bacterium]
MNAPVPVRGLFEAHLSVVNLENAVGFYRDTLGLELAAVFRERQVAFFWIGGRGRTMLGVWEAGTMPLRMSLHVAFDTALAEVLAAPSRLRAAGIDALDLSGNPTDEPVVLGWMPAAAVYFHDPDGNLLEYIAMLDEPARTGAVPWSQWERGKPGSHAEAADSGL